MDPKDLAKHVGTARFLGGVLVGALTAAGLIPPEWAGFLQSVFGVAP